MDHVTDEKELFLVQLRDPTEYEIHHACISLTEVFGFIAGIDIKEVGRPVFTLDAPPGSRQWHIHLHMDPLDRNKMRGLDEYLEQIIRSSANYLHRIFGYDWNLGVNIEKRIKMRGLDEYLEQIIKQSVTEAFHFRVSDYLHEAQHVIIAFYTP